MCRLFVCFSNLRVCSHHKLLRWTAAALLSLTLSLGPCLWPATENVVLFLERTGTCRPKRGMEPEWVVISTITCAHVTELARRPRTAEGQELSLPFPFNYRKPKHLQGDSGTFPSSSTIRRLLSNNLVRLLPSVLRPPETTWQTSRQPQRDSEEHIQATWLL